MIDFHSHILPNIDDGARNIEETFTLIEEAKRVGFEAIIATSHYMEGFYETDTPEREVWVNAIYQKLQEKSMDIKLYLGNEIYLTENMIQLLEEEKACTINDTNYVLFELPFNVKPMNLSAIVNEMLQYKLVPILAHPERYMFIQKEPQLVYDFIQKGVLMQANYASINGYYGKKAEILVKKFLKNDMIHFLGSDVHRPNTIYPQIPRILQELQRLIGAEKLKELTVINPKLVLKNKRIEVREPNKIELSLKEKWILNVKR